MFNNKPALRSEAPSSSLVTPKANTPPSPAGKRKGSPDGEPPAKRVAQVCLPSRRLDKGMPAQEAEGKSEQQLVAVAPGSPDAQVCLPRGGLTKVCLSRRLRENLSSS
jgi:hypothetical protein